MFDIQTINVKNGDIILLYFNIDYDMSDVNTIFQAIKSQLPNNQIIAIPNDMINDIQILSINKDNELQNKPDWVNSLSNIHQMNMR